MYGQTQSYDIRKHFQYTDTLFEVGEVKILSNYVYESEKPSSFDSLTSFLKHHPELRVEISCHTDNKGVDSYNLKLSNERAQTIVDTLVRRGIKSHRLTAKGYGETFPIAPDKIDGKDNPEGQLKNRRIEVKITSIDN
jgi:outer membrane protein OmpA-like peptidoglycan-associated protein